MRSSRDLVLALVLAGGCRVPLDSPPRVGDVTQDECQSSYLDYQNFGEPFVANWCRGCHSSALGVDERGRAPMQANFDTLDEVHTWQDTIATRAAGDAPTMPPAGGPSDDERAMLVEWIGCGAR